MLARDRPSEYWHPPECPFFQSETGCKAGDICLFPHYKEKAEKERLSKRRESDDKNAVAIVKSVPQLGCVSQIQMHSFLKVESFGEARCRKSWNQFKRYDLLSLRHVKRVSGKKKGPSLGKITVKVPHQQSPYAVKFEDRSHEETERQQRCARSKAWNLAKNIHKFKEKDKATFYFPAEEWVLRPRQQKSWRKESL